MIVLKNATVFNGAGAQPLSNATVVISGERIEAVGEGVMAPDGADIVIDVKGKTVLPGLIDAHVHFGGTEGFDYPGIGSRLETYNYLKSAAQALKWGVTTIRSAGDYTPDILRFRDEVKSGLHISPRIVAAGKMIQARGGHPLNTVFGGSEAIAGGVCVLVDESTDLEKEVRLLCDAGADWIKTFISEVNKLDYPTRVPRIPPEKLKQIVDLAHRFGKPCMIHVDNVSQMREAAQAGADSIEHTLSVGATDTEIDDGLIEMLLKKDICVVPTVFSVKRHENPDAGLPMVYETLLGQINKLIRAGVRIGVGTDSAIPFLPIGESLHDEFSELVLCGMTPAEAISNATRGNAKLLRKDNEIGAVLPGYYADILIVDGDPLSDVKHTKRVKYVIANGRLI